MKNLLKYFTTSSVEDGGNAPKAMVPQAVKDDPHDHSWEVIAKTYAPPAGDVKGLTNLLFECTSCKEHKKIEMIGSDETQLEDLIVKVETFGSQLFKYHDTFYVISKYVPPTQQASNLQVR